MSAYAQRVQLGPFFSAGALAGGAKLYHYAAGTSTLKDIWSDRGKTITLPQPFVADANGVFNFFADGLYKIVITDAADATLYTLDNWSMLDPSDSTFGEGVAIPSASTVPIGPEVYAHITGSTNIDNFSGTVPMFWAIFDGNLRLNHSATLLLPENQNRIVRAGEVCFFLYEGSGVYRLAGAWLPAKQTDIASAATITAPTSGSFVDITGTTTISGITASHAGHEFTARFTNAAGLNLTHGANFLMPWGRDYRVIQNEIVRFLAVTTSTWAMYSLNGPKERVGTTIEHNSSTVPAGFLEEDGSAVSRTTYSGLFAEIGTTFGAGDGSTTFNLPDSRGRATINVDGAANRITAASTGGANADTLGGTGGAETHTLSVSELPSHNHTVIVGESGAGDYAQLEGPRAEGFFYITTATSPINSTGGGGAHSNTQPWIAKKKYIRY